MKRSVIDMAVDFDGLFRQYFARHGRVAEDATEEEMEEQAQALYHGFLHTPLPELDGQTMEEYFSGKNAYLLVEELLDCAREGVSPTDYLLDAILEAPHGEEALCEALGDTGLSPAEGVAVIGLLLDLESRAPLERYREILLDEDADAALSDAAAEAVIALGDLETARLIQSRLPEILDPDNRRRLGDILSYLPVEGTYQVLLELFLHCPDAFYAQCLMRLGDGRAAEHLLSAMQAPDLRYGDYLAMRDAAESLGAILDVEREFYGDKDYELMRTMGE
jgi:hypothetical protein